MWLFKMRVQNDQLGGSGLLNILFFIMRVTDTDIIFKLSFWQNLIKPRSELGTQTHSKQSSDKLFLHMTLIRLVNWSKVQFKLGPSWKLAAIPI